MSPMFTNVASPTMYVTSDSCNPGCSAAGCCRRAGSDGPVVLAPVQLVYSGRSTDSFVGATQRLLLVRRHGSSRSDRRLGFSGSGGVFRAMNGVVGDATCWDDNVCGIMERARLNTETLVMKRTIKICWFGSMTNVEVLQKQIKYVHFYILMGSDISRDVMHSRLDQYYACNKRQ